MAYDEDPQRGSAFAMFASVDVAATRHVRAWIPGATPIRLEIPLSNADLVTSVRESPTAENVRELALRLLETTWQVEGARASEGGDRVFAEVQVEVVGLVAEGRTLSTQVLIDQLVSDEGR